MIGPEEIIRGMNRGKIEKRVNEHTCPRVSLGQRDEEGAVREMETQ